MPSVGPGVVLTVPLRPALHVWPCSPGRRRQRADQRVQHAGGGLHLAAGGARRQHTEYAGVRLPGRWWLAAGAP